MYHQHNGVRDWKTCDRILGNYVNGLSFILQFCLLFCAVADIPGTDQSCLSVLFFGGSRFFGSVLFVKFLWSQLLTLSGDFSKFVCLLDCSLLRLSIVFCWFILCVFIFFALLSKAPSRNGFCNPTYPGQQICFRRV